MGKFASQNCASSRAQSLVFVKATARKTLQHCTCDDWCFCFAGLEWNGHWVCALSISGATAANAQWFETAIHEQIAIATTAPRMLAFTLRSIVEPRPILKSFPVNRASARLSQKLRLREPQHREHQLSRVRQTAAVRLGLPLS